MEIDIIARIASISEFFCAAVAEFSAVWLCGSWSESKSFEHPNREKFYAVNAQKIPLKRLLRRQDILRRINILQTFLNAERSPTNLANQT